jgi:hypothetical protein
VTGLATTISDQAARAAARIPRERGILFSTPMVQAILAGRKSITRRLLSPADVNQIRYLGCEEDNGGQSDAVIRYLDDGHSGPGIYVHCGEYPDEGSAFVRCPYGIPGDILAVRETWATEARWDSCAPSDIPPRSRIHYLADGEKPEWAGKVRQSIFLPAWGSRIKLRLDVVSVERLQDISEEDAVAEGVQPLRTGHFTGAGMVFGTARSAFAAIWAQVNGSRAPWEGNPLVWRLEFSRIHPPTVTEGAWAP